MRVSLRGRGRGLRRQAYGERLQLVEEQRFDVLGPLVQRDLRVALQRLLDQDPQLEARERRAQAEVTAACAERLVLGLTAQVEAVGVLEAALVAVGRRVPHDDLVAGADLLPV